MINNEEKFYSYLNGKMNPDEKIRFENDLNKSSSLNNEFIEYKNLINSINEIKEIKLNKDYSESIITKFRKNLESNKSKRRFPIIRYAFATLVVAVIGYFLISSFDKEKSQNIQYLSSDFSDAELDSFSDKYHFSFNTENIVNEYDSDALDSIYNVNLSTGLMESLSKNKIDDILSINNIRDASEYLSENDVDEIYNQLINKEIL